MSAVSYDTLHVMEQIIDDLGMRDLANQSSSHEVHISDYQRSMNQKLDLDREDFLKRKRANLNYENDAEQQFKLADFKQVADSDADLHALRRELGHRTLVHHKDGFVSEGKHTPGVWFRDTRGLKPEQNLAEVDLKTIREEYVKKGIYKSREGLLNYNMVASSIRPTSDALNRYGGDVQKKEAIFGDLRLGRLRSGISQIGSDCI